MKRFLEIVAWGLAIWGLSLLWPSISGVLSPRVSDALVVGLVVTVSALFLGRHFSEQPKGNQPHQASTAQPTRPSARVERASRVTRPIPELAGALHAQATRPIPVSSGRMRHSRITRPMPLAR